MAAKYLLLLSISAEINLYLSAIKKRFLEEILSVFIINLNIFTKKYCCKKKYSINQEEAIVDVFP
ncbi:MAG: hypothetical protein ACLVEJ_11645 [Parabacteroides sp.]